MNRNRLIGVLIVMSSFCVAKEVYACTASPTAIIDNAYTQYTCIGEDTNFDASSSHDNDEDEWTIEEWTWVVHKAIGSPGYFEYVYYDTFTGETPTYSFSDAGYYKIRMEVTDNDNDTDYAYCWVKVVGVKTVVESGTTDSGPLVKPAGESFVLEAEPDPFWVTQPDGCGVDWQMESYPSGSEGTWVLPSNSSGFVVPVQLNFAGDYTIKGKCGSSDTGDAIDISVAPNVTVEITSPGTNIL